MAFQADSQNQPMDALGRKLSIKDLALCAGRLKTVEEIPFGGYRLLAIDADGNLCVHGARDKEVVDLLNDIKNQLSIMNEALLRLR